MMQYTVKKVLNNNVVVTENNNETVILIGKALGFDFPKGAVVPPERIESIFIKTSNHNKNNYDKILEIIDSEVVGISEEIIHLAEQRLNVKLNEAIHVSLPDHISFAISRIEKGIKIENPFLNELTALYPNEYDISADALYMINERFKVNLPQDEIGFICLHIKAAISSENISQSLSYTKKIGEIMELISKLLKKTLNKDSLDYARTITHINFMLQRTLQNKPTKNYLLSTIKKEFVNEFAIAIKVAMKIENLFSVSVPEDEIGYIALHLRRLSDSQE